MKTVVVCVCQQCLKTVGRDNTVIVQIPRGRMVQNVRMCRDCYAQRVSGQIRDRVRRMGLPEGPINRMLQMGKIKEHPIETALRFGKRIKEGANA